MPLFRNDKSLRYLLDNSDNGFMPLSSNDKSGPANLAQSTLYRQTKSLNRDQSSYKLSFFFNLFCNYSWIQENPVTPLSLTFDCRVVICFEDFIAGS